MNADSSLTFWFRPSDGFQGLSHVQRHGIFIPVVLVGITETTNWASSKAHHQAVRID